MKTDSTVYLLDAEQQQAKVQPSWRVPRPVGREIHTFLTDDDIRECGLMVLTKVDRNDLLDLRFDTETSHHEGRQWLVRGPANDDLVEQQANQEWLATVEGRLADLRQIAIEENLDFDETSVAAALKFLRNLPGVRQPGSFLVGGNIRLVWDSPSGEQVGLQFLGSNKIQFIILQIEDGELGSNMGLKSHDAVRRMLTLSDALSILTQ